jgi:hypothetical protein
MCRSPLQLVCIWAICLTVPGCITGAQKESTRIQRTPAEPTSLGLDCVQRVAENPEYEGIKAKLYFGADNQPPLEMLADKSHPAEAAGGKLAWGIFNQRRKDVSTQADANLRQADTQIASQAESRNENQSQLDLEQRQRATAAMEQWAHQQQILANQQQAIFAGSQPRITTISCNYYGSGNMVTCSLF